MRKSKRYENVWFKPEVIGEAHEVFDGYLTEKQKKEVRRSLSVGISGEEWNYDTDQEFFSDYRRGSKDASYRKSVGNYEFVVQVLGNVTRVAVEGPNRSEIERVFEVFERHVPQSTLPEVPAPGVTIFIGHGRSQQWRDLKDHLHEQHGYPVEAYEIGARAGHAIRDILEDMLARSSFAILVMTGEDETADGNLQARQNVIHEIGLFQGRLGFNKAIVLLEGGTKEFSNIQGIHQIRFSKGNIKETFGDVLATLRREFGQNST